MKRRILAFVLAAVLALGGSIADSRTTFAASALNEKQMTDIILKVKDKIGVGEEYTVFNYDYFEYDSTVEWNLYWATEDGSKRINAACDNDGRIKRVYVNDNGEKQKVPQYTADELEADAQKYLFKLLPELQGHVKLNKVNFVRYSGRYNFGFIRLENGIEMPDNYATVVVNSNTKAFEGCNVNWHYDVEIPSAKKIISKEEASEKIGAEINMKLAYHITYDDKGEPKAVLAYTPDRNYIAVDALSGKIYTEKNYWSIDDSVTNTESAVAEDEAAGDKGFLSPAELEKIEDLKGLISPEEAIAVLTSNDMLFMEDTINSSETSLRNDGEGNYVYDIYLSDETPIDWESEDYYRAMAFAVVDAKTGVIYSYNASVKEYYDYPVEERDNLNLKANYTKDQCRKKFETFVKSVNADRFKNTVPGSTNKARLISYDSKTNSSKYAGYAFDYQRVHEGIEVLSNNIRGEVDAVSGKIYHYAYNWNDDVKLPSSKGKLSEKQAFEKYINFDGFDLIYEIETERAVKNKKTVEKDRVRLVYRTEIYPAFVDALTGKQINYDGTEYVSQENSFEYSDIAGTKYERTIKLLAGMGVGFKGDKFEPAKAITKAEFDELLSKAFYFGRTDAAPSKSSKKLTREAAAWKVVSYFGMEKVAKLDIYKTGFSDEAKISKKYMGAVALSKGLGMLPYNGKKFKPKSAVTRGEAAQIVFNIITAE